MDEKLPWEEVVFVGTVLTLMTAITLLVLWQAFRILQMWLATRLERRLSEYRAIKQELADLRASVDGEPSLER